MASRAIAFLTGSVIQVLGLALDASGLDAVALFLSEELPWTVAPPAR